MTYKHKEMKVRTLIASAFSFVIRGACCCCGLANSPPGTNVFAPFCFFFAFSPDLDLNNFRADSRSYSKQNKTHMKSDH